MRKIGLVFILIISLLFTACGGGEEGSAEAAPELFHDIPVYTGAVINNGAMDPLVQEMLAIWQEGNPGKSVDVQGWLIDPAVTSDVLDDFYTSALQDWTLNEANTYQRQDGVQFYAMDWRKGQNVFYVNYFIEQGILILAYIQP